MVGSGNGVDSIQAREGSPGRTEGKNRRLMSSGVPSSGVRSNEIDDAAAEGSLSGTLTSDRGSADSMERKAGGFHLPRDTARSSPDGGRSASGFRRGDGGADS